MEAGGAGRGLNKTAARGGGATHMVRGFLAAI